MYVLKDSPFLRGRIRNAFQDIHGCQQIASQQVAPAIWSNIRNPQICTANRSFLMFGRVSKSSVPQFYFFEKYHIVRKESTR